ncbi:MAG: SLBB domain-containing protein [Gammaproteobacteria bacterium]|nr:SLBB domain-containing protein [Gammaproteobacteria bacterium]
MIDSCRPLWEMTSSVMERALPAILLVLVTSVTFAQGIQLSAEQQQMLNQLPPAQRQQAVDAIRQLQSQQASSTQQSINEPLVSAGSPPAADSIDQILSDLEPRAEGRSRLVLNFTPSKSLSAAQRRSLAQDAALQDLTGSRLFILDDSGVLTLPGLEPIPLLGLNEADINRRLGAEPYLSVFNINARILGQTLTGIEALKPFGYDVFESRTATLAAPASGPVPPDYVLGPGDSVRVQLFGNVNGIYEYEVSRDGVLNLPEIGPVTVAGLSFSEFRADINKRVKEMLIGTQVSVTMGQLRTIRVFVLGDVNEPGSYVVSGLATVSGALYEGGGISKVGSLRNVQLKRNGRVVARLDLYDLLLKGDTSSDRRLHPGDVIFVPPIGNTIGVGGAVKRPAIYETKGEATIADAVELAGGLAPEAFGKGARVERVDGGKTTIAVDLSSTDSSRLRIHSGDTLIVPEVLPSLEDTVVLAGHVFRPGNYPWRPGMRLTDLVQSPEELKPGVDTGYVLIRRERARGQPIQVLSANLGAALHSPARPDNVRLEASDTVHVFSLALGRQRVVEPLLEELRLQSTIDAPVKKVQISGNVRAPGEYPLEANMRVSDLIRAGGNLSEAAYALEAELTRYSVDGSIGREMEVVEVDLDAIRKGVESADLALREHDYLIINRIPDWDSTWTVTLEGEVRFPGQYRVRHGETLAEVVQRAGGFTENAFVEGAVFLRESLKEQEQEQIENLARRMEADLATLSLQTAAAGGSDTLSTGRVLLEQLRSTEAVGRLVIDMRRVESGIGGSAADVEMRDGDTLLVPTQPQVVSVLGETQQNTSHLFRDNLSRDEYIGLSGGLTRRADKKLIYVVRANGAVVAGNRSRWLGRGSNTEIRPGDTIVVPLDTDRMRPLTFWGNVTQILYQGAIAVAAVKTFDN